MLALRIPAMSRNAIEVKLATSMLHNQRQGPGSSGSMVLTWKQIGRLRTGRSPCLECPSLQVGSTGEGRVGAKLWSLLVRFSTCENRPCGLSGPFPRLQSCEDTNTALGALAPLFLAPTVSYMHKVLWRLLWGGDEPLLLCLACLLVYFPLLLPPQAVSCCWGQNETWG